MVKNRQRKLKSESKTKLIFFLKKELLGLMIYTVISAVVSFCALMADIHENKMYMISLVSLSVASLVFAYISVFKERKNGLLYGVINALPINSLFIILSLIFCQFKGNYHIIISIVALIFSSAIGGILSVNRRIKR